MGSYTLEGWRAFINTLNDNGIFTVSRWFNPDDVKETGRMIGLATAALLDMGVSDARPHLFVARANHIATLVLSKSPFTPSSFWFSRARSSGSDSTCCWPRTSYRTRPYWLA